jgi:hypothetical protein
MAQSGYTPLIHYYSTTASQVPIAGNLSNGELAINITDGKLYYKNNSGVVTLLANAFAAAGTVTSVNGSGGSTGMTLTGGPITSSGTLTIGGTLAATNGGTGFGSYAVGDVLYASSTTALSKLSVGTNGYVLTLVSGVPAWQPVGAGSNVTSISFGSTGLTPATATNGVVTVAGTLVATSGGTGFATYTAGKALYSDTTTTIANGTLPTTGGGTGLASFTSGGAVYASSTSVLTTGTLPTASGGTNLTSFTSGGALYATSTSVLASGTLPVTAGGTGATSLSGIVIGNAGAAFTTVSAPSGTVVGTTDTQTLTNKRINPRIATIADATSVTIAGDSTDQANQANTQTAGTLTINAPTGTPVDGQKLIFRLQSTNIQTFSWNAIFAGSTGLSLPTASTGSSKYDLMGFIYNSTASKWQLVGTSFGY